MNIIHNKGDRGSALIISLVILSAVTFLAIMSMQNSSIQLKMVANSQHSQLAFNNVLSELEYQYTASQEGGDIEDTLGEAARNSYIDQVSGELVFEPVTVEAVTSGGKNIDVEILASRQRNLNAELNGNITAGYFSKIKFEITASENINNIFTSDQTMGITRNLVPRS